MQQKRCSRYIKAWYFLSSSLVISLQFSLLLLFRMGEQIGLGSWNRLYVGGTLLISFLTLGLLALAASYTLYRIGRVFQATTEALVQLECGDRSVILSFPSAEGLTELERAFNSVATSYELLKKKASSIPHLSGETTSHAHCCQRSESRDRAGVLPSGRTEGA